jgi:uncharacterized protein
MRISDVAVGLGLVALGLSLSPAASFDGSPAVGQTVAVPLNGPAANPSAEGGVEGPTPLPAVPVPARPTLQSLPPPSRPTSAIEAYRSGTRALALGDTARALDELEFAADRGIPAAQWKLGRMFADGDGVSKDPSRAFEYFSRLTRAHGNDIPGTSQARMVADAFVSLGQFYQDGIPDSTIMPDPNRAREMYLYAASYFADPDAQYNLGRLFLDRTSPSRDPRQAAKWLGLAAKKGQYRAQALLGEMLFKGDGVVTRQPARGLFWLILARDRAGAEETWINDSYTAAFADATDADRTLAYKYLEEWLAQGRE